MAVKVAIDFSAASLGGGITYLREILPRLLQSKVGVGPILARSDNERVSAALPNECDIVSATSRTAARSRAWRAAVEASGSAIVYAPTEISFANYSIPLVLALRNSLVFDRDLRTLLSGGARNRARTRFWLARRSSRSAAFHIAVSRYAAEAGSVHLGVSPVKIRVIHHGGPPPGLRPEKRPLRDFLYVGVVSQHKNLLQTLPALAEVAPDTKLTVVGSRAVDEYNRKIDRAIRALGLAERVGFVGHLEGDELAHAYRSTDCLLWPSLAESFGHPLLEAQSASLPIIASDVGAHREITGDAAEYFNPTQPDSLHRVLQKATREGLDIGDLPRLYDWDVCVEKLEEELMRVANQV